MRSCDLTGHKCLSPYSPDKPYKVYYHKEWWKQQASFRDFGRDFDFGRPFFEQYAALRDVVPVESLRNAQCENSEYANNARKCRNCYLMLGAVESEDCMYLDGAVGCKTTILGWQVTKCECSYSLYRCQGVFSCCYCQLCFGCFDCWFCKQCKDCHFCFGCSQLRHRKYCIFNEQYTKEGYFEFLNKINTGSRKVIEYWRAKTQEFYLTVPEPNCRGFNNEDVTGDVVFNSKRCQEVFTVANDEDCKYLWESSNNVHALDLDNTNVTTGLCYQTVQCTGLFNTQFAANAHSCSDCMYVTECQQLKSCFGCIGLFNCQYCILNKQYTKEDYCRLIERISDHMRLTGEWGRFFPLHLSRFGYNETTAGGQYVLTKEEALKQGFNWCDYVEPRPDLPGLISGNDLPDDIADVPDSILDAPIACPASGRRFRIQKAELAFYRKMKLPLPTMYFKSQLGTVYRLRPFMRLYYDRRCDNIISGERCPNMFATAFDFNSKQKVFCQSCHLQHAYVKDEIRGEVSSFMQIGP